MTALAIVLGVVAIAGIVVAALAWKRAQAAEQALQSQQRSGGLQNLIRTAAPLLALL